MCGRVIQSSGPLRLAIVDGLDASDSRMGNVPARYNAAPSQELLAIRQNHKTGERSLDLIKWGLIPYWCTDPKGGRKPMFYRCRSEREDRTSIEGCPRDPTIGREQSERASLTWAARVFHLVSASTLWFALMTAVGTKHTCVRCHQVRF
jgi:hypothetical protein